MIEAAGYILRVPANRRKLLLDQTVEEGSWYGSRPMVSEPVTRFDHSRNAPLIVFGCFADDAITHLADGKRGASAGTKLSRLNMADLQPLIRPVSFSELLTKVPERVKAHVARLLKTGGKLPPKSLGATVDALLAIDSNLAGRLMRFSESRRQRIARLSSKARANLALQKETLGAALQISGIGTEDLLAWSPAEKDEQPLFLQGLSEVRSREDAMVVSDLSVLPGFSVIKDYTFAAKTFVSERDRRLKLTVIMANHLPLEEQTGADLIYYNEAYKSFVFVQYKAMEREGQTSTFRWTASDQLTDEIARMNSILDELKHVAQDSDPRSFRLHENPFFLKICPRMNFNPDDKGLFPGMYLPLDYWKCLATHDSTKGPKGGRYLTYDNVGRRLNNTEFASIVAGAWVGTTALQSVVLEKLIRTVLQSGKTVTFAVKRDPPTEPDAQSAMGWLDEPTGSKRDEEPPLTVLS